MKHIKLFEAFKWETIPSHIIDNVKNIILEYFSKKLNVSLNDIPFDYMLGLNKVVRDIIMYLKNDLNPVKKKYPNNHFLTVEEGVKLRLTNHFKKSSSHTGSYAADIEVVNSLKEDIDELVTAIIKSVDADMQIYWSSKLKKARNIGVFDKDSDL